jgi:hypothetical protein
MAAILKDNFIIKNLKDLKIFVCFDATNIGFQILTVKHYFSKKLTKSDRSNNHAGFGAYLFSITHKKAEKGIAG